MQDSSHGAQEGSDPVFVLVRPQLGENIGASARAMWNFGLERMRVVDPRDGWPNPAAYSMATGAGRLLDHAGHFESLPEAVSDCARVYATTARPRDLTKELLTPEEAAAAIDADIQAGNRVAVLFGPERTGLTTEDVTVASAIVSVKTNPEFSSLNLGQCVLLMAYEWGRRRLDPLPRKGELSPLATVEHVERLHGILAGHLEESGYFSARDREPSMRANLRNLVSRLPLTEADVRTLHGVFVSLRKAGPKA